MVTVRSNSTLARRVASVPDAHPSRLSGLDGLRAVAVIGVLIFHAGVTHLPGGFLGVDLFFVISGFLITWLLIAERQRSGRIALGRFYLRRARRLLPALVTMIVATTVFMALFFRGDLAEARGDIGAAAGYFSNWWYVLHHRSYFVAAGRQPPLQHLWSLAVEEQFYLVWPLLLIILLAARARLRWVFVVAAAGALASAWWMRTLAIEGNVPFDTDSARLYYGTDTHASALLLGAAGAAVMTALARRRARTGRVVSPTTTLLADLAGLVTLAGVVWMMHAWTSVSPDLFRGGFLVFAAVALVLVVTVSLPGSLLGALLDLPLLRWVGTRSYGLYLWHWPVFVYTRPGLDWQLFGWKAFAVRIGITAVLTELTFQLVERPIRERGFLTYLRGGPRWRPQRLPATAWGTAAPALAATCLVVAVGGTALATHYRTGDATRHTASDVVADPAPPSPSLPPPSPSASTPAQSPPAATPGQTSSTSAAASPTPSRPVHTPSRAVTPPAKVPPPPGAESSTPPPIPPGPPPPLTAVGDSVMIDGEVALKQDCPGAEVYAAIGWQAKSVFGQLDALRKAEHLGAVVVIGTGTNGVVSGKELGAVLTSLADRSRVVVVNNFMDRDWEAPNNAMFAQVVSAHPNAVLVDWYAVANKHPDWFWSDGVHLKPTGRQPYADLISHAAGC